MVRTEGLAPRSSVTQQLFEGLGVHAAGSERKLADFWQVVESKGETTKSDHLEQHR